MGDTSFFNLLIASGSFVVSESPCGGPKDFLFFFFRGREWEFLKASTLAYIIGEQLRKEQQREKQSTHHYSRVYISRRSYTFHRLIQALSEAIGSSFYFPVWSSLMKGGWTTCAFWYSRGGWKSIVRCSFTGRFRLWKQILKLVHQIVYFKTFRTLGELGLASLLWSFARQPHSWHFCKARGIAASSTDANLTHHPWPGQSLFWQPPRV